uniref:PID domain-containing protein n=1 Tax=Panagrellus redivivus TaxID=6233 RepID=A0A7E4VJX9_PANRE
MVAQQKMKNDNLSDSSDSSTKPGSLVSKSRLAMLKRSTKQKAATTTPAATDPFRFQGNGVDFKGKLIGEHVVAEARGDEMCAAAMKLVKAQIKAQGAHKPRIILNISIDGLKIREEKSSVVMYNFPVSKISFIARDTADARAFGFVFGAAEGKYIFYGIKTTQTADHAVLAIRDMFQVVFEMKKKQIEKVKQQKEDQENHVVENGQAVEEADIRIEDGIRMADLIDLESELEHIANNYNQLQNIPSMPEDSWPTTSNPVASAPQPVPAAAGNGFFVDPFGGPFVQQAAQPASNGASWPAFPPAPTPSTTPAFSNSNPFLQQTTTPPSQSVTSASFPVFNPPLNTVATVQPQLPADPFDTHGLRQAITAIPTLSSLPLPPAPAPSTNAFATDFNAFQPAPKKSVDIDSLFNELIDTNVLMAKAPESKKNPFDHIINPPKPSLVALQANTTGCGSPAQGTIPAQQFVMPTARSDPFNDDFFN